MGEHIARSPGRDRMRLLAAGLIVAAVGGFLLIDRLGGEAASDPAARSSDEAPVAAVEPIQQVVPGRLLMRKPEPDPPPTPSAPPAPLALPASEGRAGTGLQFGALGALDLPPVGFTGPLGEVTTAVANIPNRTGDAGFASSMSTLASAEPDFMMLNEVSRHSTSSIAARAPGYAAYRDPVADRSAGGTQAMNNVVLWRTDAWRLVDAGRVKLVDDDRGFRQGKPFTWDRYATWALLQRSDGAVVSVVSTHMMTNPAKYPRQHGRNRFSRATQYGVGMDVLIETVRSLSPHGPVIVGGDMNTHGREGSWSAVSKLGAAGFSHVKDRAVMYTFYPASASVVSHREVRVASDHPGIITRLALG